MWPPGHLAVGYLSYALYRRYRKDQPPKSVATIALAVGTLLPDIVDKPLSWTLTILPSGRSLAHSVVTATVVSLVVGQYARAIDRAELGNAFAIGYGSHLLADLYTAVVAGDAETNWFLFWPIVPQEEYVSRPGFLAYVELVGWVGVAAFAYVVAFAVAVAVLSYRTETTVRSVIAFIVMGVATTAGLVLWSGVVSPWTVLELVLVLTAAAVWVRDGSPGLPRPQCEEQNNR